MMKNDQLIASIFAYTVGDYADAGNAVIVHLNTGDKVYVKAHNNYVHTLYGRTNQIYNTFTGELLFADNLAPIEGTYLFHFHALSYENSEFWLELFHDSHYV